MHDLDILEEILSVRAAVKIMQVVRLDRASKASESEKRNTLFSMELAAMAKAHLKLMTFKIYRQVVDQEKFRDAKITQLMQLLIKVYA